LFLKDAVLDRLQHNAYKIELKGELIISGFSVKMSKVSPEFGPLFACSTPDVCMME
jgi:hypothetical protein